MKLYDYFKNKYPNLREVRYYEGIAKDDVKKRRTFELLRQKGYIICSLERITYKMVSTSMREVKCPKCNNEWTMKIIQKRKAMKSNVDVYLAADMLMRASQISQPTRFILVSCDGDYVEAVKDIISLNDNVSVAILATPSVADKMRGTLSTRLKNLLNEVPRYRLHDISAIRDAIEQQAKLKTKKDGSVL